MKAILNFLLLVMSIFFISACDNFDLMESKGKFYYSNPTKNNIIFKIDGKKYDVLPNHHGVIQLSSGLHTMADNKNNITTFMVFEHNSGGIINPYHFVYYTLSEVYSVEENSDIFKPSIQPVIFHGHELAMPIRSTSAQIIDANLFRCHSPIGERLPTLIASKNNNFEGNIQSKCFDESEITEYIDLKENSSLISEIEKDNAMNSVNMKFNYEIPSVDFSDPQVQSTAQQLIKLVMQLQESNNTDIHDRLNTQFHQLSIDFVNAYTASSINYSSEENERYNAFFKQINQLRNGGIWIR